MSLADTLAAARIVPVIVIRDASDAVPLARALVAGGLTMLEITLRSDAALESIRRIAGEVEGAEVGAGTVLNARDMAKSKQAGARFAVSPGLTQSLADAAQEMALPLLPGVATASEILRGLEWGYTLFKFFPAQTAGGAPALKAFAGPFPNVRFCPTGGITPDNLGDYMALPNVVAAGGSWMIPADFKAERDSARVTALSADAIARARR